MSQQNQKRIQQLTDRGFEFFKHLSSSPDGNLDKIVTEQGFHLLKTAMSGDVQLNSVELQSLLAMADKFVAENEALEKTLATFFHSASIQDLSWFSDLEDKAIFREIKAAASKQYAVRCDDAKNESMLEGEDITVESKGENFKMLTFFAALCPGIRVKDGNILE